MKSKEQVKNMVIDIKKGTQYNMNITRQRSVERRFVKRIQAMKIVIHMLYGGRLWSDDEPSFIVKREFEAEKPRKLIRKS